MRSKGLRPEKCWAGVAVNISPSFLKSPHQSNSVIFSLLIPQPLRRAPTPKGTKKNVQAKSLLCELTFLKSLVDLVQPQEDFLWAFARCLLQKKVEPKRFRLHPFFYLIKKIWSSVYKLFFFFTEIIRFRNFLKVLTAWELPKLGATRKPYNQKYH